jgi:predicted SnoaL-like aldol condensation-catalyzing enzyme
MRQCQYRLAHASNAVRALNMKREEMNKGLVLEASNMLLNKREYATAERYWSPNYIQNSAHIPAGRDGLFNLIKANPPSLNSNMD